ncbi:MAG: ABC transporter permease [Gammaproteobacteria bacterium]
MMMAVNASRLALRSLARDWRAGELRILVLSLVVAVGAVTAVAFFTDRIQRAMSLQASELLAADLVIETSAPPRERLLTEARARGLRIANTVTFPSVVLSGDDTQLVQVKAVDENYPLRGQMRIAPALDRPAHATQRIPDRGGAWADPRLMLNLGLATGESINLGDRRFEISAVIDYEPDRGGELFQLSSRVMINLEDLESTGLISANSRVSYHVLLAGPAEGIAAYRQWLEPRAQPGEEIQGARDGRPETRAALDRAQQYLGLAALVAVLVAGAAIALAARHYAQNQADVSAIMRCLGASQALVLQIYVWRLLMLGLAASLAGCLLGYVAQTVLAALLEGWLAQHVPPPGFSPVLTGLVTGLLALYGFALPPLLRLKQVPPLRVLRRELGNPTPATWMTGAFALAAVCLLFALQAGDAVLTAKLLLGAIVTVAALWLAAFALILCLRRVQPRAGAIWRNGLARLGRRPASSTLQIAAFALGLAALLVLAIARVDLLNIWRGSLPADAPNYFMINIQKPEVAAIANLFRANDLSKPSFYPMVRGRLVAIDDREVGAADYEEPRAKQLINREFNLSWGDSLQADNKIMAGQWWGSAGVDTKGFSVETGIAETLGIKLGDRLRYSIAGQTLEAPVTNLRSVKWDSFNVNFFVIATPAALDDQPASWITAFYLPPAKDRLIATLARQFPGVTVLNVEAILEQVRAIMDRAALAVEYVFLFTLAAGVLVMYAAIQTSHQERRRETALLRALGASRRQVRLSLIAEFGAVGLVAGVLAAVAATLAGYFLATQVFDLPYRINVWLWACGVVAGGAGITAAGLLATRRVLNQSPLLVLRRV